jgi:hypothetical protein
VLGAAVEFFLFTGLACFLVLVAAGFAVLEVLGVLPAAGGLVCAAKVNGTMASASERVVSVFFIFFSPGGPYCPLTIPSCGDRQKYPIASTGYKSRRIRGIGG